MIGPITDPQLQAWAAQALADGRLSWRVTDAQGRPCNGGDADPLPIGEWSPTIEDAQICTRGWHTTSDPLRWRGVRVWLVEGEGAAGREEDKACWRRIRPLAEVDPRGAIDDRVRIAAMRTNLYRANLTGADLSRANLSGADLSRANLSGANLTGADLSRANLSGADLSRANLSGANLTEANLSRANLSGANLTEANLYRANLYGANLYGANLYRANLYGANLYGANLSGVDLTGWECGPDGYARRAP